jgi:hypothetical protein
VVYGGINRYKYTQNTIPKWVVYLWHWKKLPHYIIVVVSDFGSPKSQNHSIFITSWMVFSLFFLSAWRDQWWRPCYWSQAATALVLPLALGLGFVSGAQSSGQSRWKLLHQLTGSLPFLLGNNWKPIQCNTVCKAQENSAILCISVKQRLDILWRKNQLFAEQGALVRSEFNFQARLEPQNWSLPETVPWRMSPAPHNSHVGLRPCHGQLPRCRCQGILALPPHLQWQGGTSNGLPAKNLLWEVWILNP